MPPPKLRRPLKLLERHWPWALLTLLAIVGLAATVVLLDLGLLVEIHDSLGASLRGYTVFGLATGFGAVVLIGLATFYTFRKRSLQERLGPLRSSMTVWLWAHVYLGLFALLLALAHAGYGSISFEWSSGKLLLIVLALLVVSGLSWRLVYKLVPPMAAREVGNYAQAASSERADLQLVEVEKISAGRSARFHELKNWFLVNRPSKAEVEHAAHSLSPDERAVFAELTRVAITREQELTRQRRQAVFARRLQSWRYLHVPLMLALFVLLPVHIVRALGFPERLLEPTSEAAALVGAFDSAEDCANCHRTLTEQWRRSMHAHAMTSPLMIAQTNQVVAQILKDQATPDPKEICVNCHGPIGAALTEQADLPLAAAALGPDETLLNEGVSCVVCHAWDGTSVSAGGGLSSFQDGLTPGRVFYGPNADPVDNAYHRSKKSPLFDEPERLCQNCHSVVYDRNADGKIVKGTDLVLQTLFDEWRVYRAAGGASCIDCHMPKTTLERGADDALIPFEQDREAPRRSVRDHRFVAVDYPLDRNPAADTERPVRQALLRRAATLQFAEPPRRSGDVLEFAMKVTNSGTGHNLPGGFAFVRQMWLEVSVADARGALIAQSGRVAKPSDDLCDTSILGDPNSPMRELLVGCTAADPLLVNFQQKLVDSVTPLTDASGAAVLDDFGQPKLKGTDGAKEVALQHISGGPVPRRRPHAGELMTTLRAGDSATYRYRISVKSAGSVELGVRLLFRATAPYFIRALAKGEAPDSAARLNALVENLQIEEMASVAQRL